MHKRLFGVDVKKIGGDASSRHGDGGSFGTQKEYYSLRRIKARKKDTEILYIFFGIHTANAVQLAERLIYQQLAEAA